MSNKFLKHEIELKPSLSVKVKNMSPKTSIDKKLLKVDFGS